MRETNKYQQKLEKLILEFSSSYMSNSKWLKLFKELSNVNSIIKKCSIKIVGEQTLWEIEIPNPSDFSDTFNLTGIKDVLIGGPLSFKEIEQLIFPKNWEIERRMRSEKLKPHEFNQDLNSIANTLNKVGYLALEVQEDSITVYGYK